MGITREDQKTIKRSYEEVIDAIDMYIICQRKFKLRLKEEKDSNSCSFHLMTRMSLLSNGEEIEVRLNALEDKRTEIKIISKSRWKMSIWDMGVNEKNVKKLFEGIEEFSKNKYKA